MTTAKIGSAYILLHINIEVQLDLAFKASLHLPPVSLQPACCDDGSSLYEGRTNPTTTILSMPT